MELTSTPIDSFIPWTGRNSPSSWVNDKLAYEMANPVCLSVLRPIQIVNHLSDFREISYDPYDDTCHLWKQVTIYVKSAITWYYAEFQEEIVWSSLRLCTRSLSKAVTDFTAALRPIASALTKRCSLDVTSYDTSVQVSFPLSKVLPDWVSLLEVTKTLCFFLPV